MFTRLLYSEIVRKTFFSMGVKVFSIFLSFVLTVVASRMLSSEDMGLFFICLSLLVITSVIARRGMDGAAIKAISQHQALDHGLEIPSIVHFILVRVLFSGMVVGLLFIAFKAILADVFDNPQLEALLVPIGAAVIPFSLLMIAGAMFQGDKQFGKSVFFLTGMVPLITLLIVNFPIREFSVFELIVCYVIAIFLATAIALFLWHKKYPVFPVKKANDVSDVKKVSANLYVISLLRALVTWFPILILGVLVPEKEVALFAIGNKLSQFMGLILIAVNSYAAPKFSELFHRNEFGQLDLVAKRTALIGIFSATPILLVFMLYPEYLLGIFGEQYKSAVLVFQILTLAQYINVVTGSAGYLLTMTGNDALQRNNLMVASGVTLVACVVFSLIWGKVGAAVAILVGTVLGNLVSIFIAYRVLGVSTVPFLPGRHRIEN